MDIEEAIQAKQVLIFDLDDTLCNHDESVESARREAYFHGERLGALSAGVDLAARSALRERVREVLARPPEPVLRDQFGAAQRVETWLELLRPLGIDSRMAASRAAATYERRRMEELKPLPEVRKVLEILKRSHRLYILADGSAAHQRQAVRRLRIDELVEGVFYEEEMDLHRSNPNLFRGLLETLGVSADQVLFAGDDPRTDFAGAAAAGVFTLWRRRTPSSSSKGAAPDFTVDSFLELFPRLERRMGDR